MIEGHQLHARAGRVAGRLSRRSRRLSGIAACLVRPNRCPSSGRQDGVGDDSCFGGGGGAVRGDDSGGAARAVAAAAKARRRPRRRPPAPSHGAHEGLALPPPPRARRSACGRSGFGPMFHHVQARAVGSKAECRGGAGGALVVGPACSSERGGATKRWP